VVAKPERKRPLERQRCRWKDGIRMDLREIGSGVWSRFTWLRIGTRALVNVVMNLQVPAPHS
jgi:hypothetical protein